MSIFSGGNPKRVNPSAVVTVHDDISVSECAERARVSGVGSGGVFTYSGCRGVWPPFPPAEVCSFRARTPDRLQGGTGPRSVTHNNKLFDPNIYNNHFKSLF